MKSLLFLCASVCFCTPVQAQQYHTSLGIKSDITTRDVPSAELSLKHFFVGPSAFELNIGGSQRFGWMQLMYIRNQTINRDLDWYWGGGVDGGVWFLTSYGRTDVGTTHGYWAGFDGTVGLEYTFNVVPINLALDTGPTLSVVPSVKFGWMAGFAIRFAFR